MKHDQSKQKMEALRRQLRQVEISEKRQHARNEQARKLFRTAKTRLDQAKQHVKKGKQTFCVAKKALKRSARKLQKLRDALAKLEKKLIKRVPGKKPATARPAPSKQPKVRVAMQAPAREAALAG